MDEKDLKNCNGRIKREGLKKSLIDHLADRLLSHDEELFSNAVDRIESANPKNVQEVAATQIRLLNSYYETILLQAKRSFLFAVTFASIGLLLFFIAIIFFLFLHTSNAAAISVVGGVIVQVISGINFVFYGKTTSQLSVFHNRLEKTQRFLLANSVCESLENELKGKARMHLIYTIISDSSEQSCNESDKLLNPKEQATISK
jgi:hypothetical protein